MWWVRVPEIRIARPNRDKMGGFDALNDELFFVLLASIFKSVSKKTSYMEI